MAHTKEPADGANVGGLSKCVQLGGERGKATAIQPVPQARLPGWQDPAQLQLAALRNAAVAGHIGGHAGAALLRLAAAYASRAIGGEVSLG